MCVCEWKSACMRAEMLAIIGVYVCANSKTYLQIYIVRTYVWLNFYQSNTASLSTLLHITLRRFFIQNMHLYGNLEIYFVLFLYRNVYVRCSRFNGYLERMWVSCCTLKCKAYLNYKYYSCCCCCCLITKSNNIDNKK